VENATGLVGGLVVSVGRLAGFAVFLVEPGLLMPLDAEDGFNAELARIIGSALRSLLR